MWTISVSTGAGWLSRSGPEVNEASQFSGGVVFVPPGKGHTRHNHPGAEEIIFIIKGRGEQMVEDEDGNPETREVGPGCTVFIPESRFHSTQNTGSEPMEIFVVYSPAGPETGLTRTSGLSHHSRRKRLTFRHRQSQGLIHEHAFCIDG